MSERSSLVRSAGHVRWVGLVLTVLSGMLGCKEPEAGSIPPRANPSSTVTAEAAPEKPKERASEAKLALEFRGPGERLVREIGGFSINTAPRYFGPRDLYTLINGGAESYVAHGLKEMVTVDYTCPTKSKVTVTVEIYDMAVSKNASARFARFLDGQQDPASAGSGLPEGMKSRGLLGTANAAFWKDRYLVTLTLLDESETATKESLAVLGRELLPLFAKAIDENI